MCVRPPFITMVSNAMMRAGKGLLRDFREIENLQNAVQGVERFVQAAMRRTQSTLHEAMSKLYPTHALVMAGQDAVPDTPLDGSQWVIDAVNGQENFSHGLPCFAISAALIERGQLQAGLIYDPISHDLYWAHRGSGAFLNQNRLRVCGRKQLNVATFGISSQGCTTPHHWSVVSTLNKSSASVRMWGCPALELAYVAAGRLDGFWGPALPLTACAAGLVLVREAGGMIKRFGGMIDTACLDTVAGAEVSFGLLTRLSKPVQTPSDPDSTIQAFNAARPIASGTVSG